MGLHGGLAGYSRYLGTVGASSTEDTQSSVPTNLVESLSDQSSSGGGDILDISPEAELAANALERRLAGGLPLGLKGLFGEAGADGRMTLDEMEQLQQETLSSVQSRLTSLFAEEGIDTSSEIQLKVASDGRVIVANNHPQTAEIESLFADDPELRNEFARMVSLTEMVGAAQEAAAFQKAYAMNPNAAMTQYKYLFDQTDPAEVSLRIQGNEFKASYERFGVAMITVGGSER